MKRPYKEEEKRTGTFIKESLGPHLREDPTKNHFIPKKMVIELYFKWCNMKKYQPLVPMMQLKMLLTNSLKLMFPKLEHN